MPRLTITASILLLVALACAHGADRAAAPDPIGCWYFEQDDAARQLVLPWGVRLAADTLTGWPAMDARGGARVAATLAPGEELGHPFGYWLELSGDSIQVGYPGGGGLSLRLEVSESVLQGSARPVGDALPLNAPARTTHAVRLTRAMCP